MEQLEMLWQYQQEDMKADAIANDIRRSPLRQKLEKDRDFIVEQQKRYKQIEEQVASMADRKDVLQDAVSRCEKQLAALQARFEEAQPDSLEAARSLIEEVARCRETIAQYEQEIRTMVKETASYDQKQKTIRHETAKVKQEFDQLKVEYEKEAAEKKAALEKQKAAAKQAMEGIEADLLAEYNAIRKHITPPMARLVYDQCSGCNTSLPSAVLRKIRNGDKVECETCGRMIIQ